MNPRMSKLDLDDVDDPTPIPTPPGTPKQYALTSKMRGSDDFSGGKMPVLYREPSTPDMIRTRKRPSVMLSKTKDRYLIPVHKGRLRSLIDATTPNLNLFLFSILLCALILLPWIVFEDYFGVTWTMLSLLGAPISVNLSDTFIVFVILYDLVSYAAVFTILFYTFKGRRWKRLLWIGIISWLLQVIFEVVLAVGVLGLHAEFISLISQVIWLLSVVIQSVFISKHHWWRMSFPFVFTNVALFVMDGWLFPSYLAGDSYLRLLFRVVVWPAIWNFVIFCTHILAVYPENGNNNDNKPKPLVLEEKSQSESARVSLEFGVGEQETEKISGGIEEGMDFESMDWLVILPMTFNSILCRLLSLGLESLWLIAVVSIANSIVEVVLRMAMRKMHIMWIDWKYKWKEDDREIKSVLERERANQRRFALYMAHDSLLDYIGVIVATTVGVIYHFSPLSVYGPADFNVITVVLAMVIQIAIEFVVDLVVALVWIPFPTSAGWSWQSNGQFNKRWRPMLVVYVVSALYATSIITPLGNVFFLGKHLPYMAFGAN